MKSCGSSYRGPKVRIITCRLEAKGQSKIALNSHSTKRNASSIRNDSCLAGGVKTIGGIAALASRVILLPRVCGCCARFKDLRNDGDQIYECLHQLWDTHDKAVHVRRQLAGNKELPEKYSRDKT